MGIQFEVDVKSDYVYLSCTGVFSSDAFLDVFEKGLTIAEDKELMAILVDIRGLGGAPPSTIQRFDQSEAFQRMQLRHSSRICVVLVGDEPLTSLFLLVFYPFLISIICKL
jgi:hypothetical protein